MRQDSARGWTDAHLEEIERHLAQIYRQSRDELTEKWEAYMERGQERLADLYASYQSAPTDKKADALRRYQEASQNYTLRNRWYREMIDQTTYRLAHVNDIAISYINGEMPSVYVQNFNYVDPVALSIQPNWTLTNEQMVHNLVLDSLPQKTVNYAKDMAWNTKQINASVLQGILQGESIGGISKRLMPVVNNNLKSAIRTARTMVTGAENRGRQDRYRDYEEQGVVMKKVWIATPDTRTRDWHMSMDGQERDVDEPFTDGLGNELQYPGDWGAPAETIYNCRCTTRSHIIGVRSGSRLIKVADFETSSLHSSQIAQERARRRNG